MSRHDPERDLNRLLDADRGEYGALYQRLSRTEPPRRIDRAVLGEASRAIRGNHRPARAQRWLIGLGSAAGVVLAAGIAWQVGQQVRTQQVVAPVAEDARARDSGFIPVQPIIVPAEPSSTGAMSARIEELAAQPGAKTEPVVAKARAAAPVARPQAPPPAPALPAPPAPAMAREETPLPDVRDTATAEAFPEKSERDDATSAPQAKSAPAESDMGGTAKPSEIRMGSERESDARRTRAMSPQAPSGSVQLRNNMQLAPEVWLAEIVRLERAGRRQQAIENLRLFQRLHPDWELPESLRRLQE